MFCIVNSNNRNLVFSEIIKMKMNAQCFDAIDYYDFVEYQDINELIESFKHTNKIIDLINHTETDVKPIIFKTQLNAIEFINENQDKIDDKDTLEIAKIKDYE